MPFPNHIAKAFSGLPGFEEDAFCKVHEEGRLVISVRLNPNKLPAAGALSFELQQPVPWASNGFYLSERPLFTFEPLLHAGAFYVQEASSMFLEQVMRQTFDLQKPMTVLDLSAAPGGKSTHLLSLLPDDSVLVSNEVIRNRVSILEENITKWGSIHAVITNNDPREFTKLGGLFDLIVVDAPCSGSGMFRKDPASISGWSHNLVNLCSQRQQRILADIWPALKEGGILIYATCSYSKEEDEDIADFIMDQLEAESVPVNTLQEWNIVSSQSEKKGAACYRFYPGKILGEGFFIAAFRKTGQAARPKTTKSRSRWELLPASAKPVVKPWLHASEISLLGEAGELYAVRPAVLELLPYIVPLHIRTAGVRLGKWSGKELIPDHALALSSIHAGNLPALSVDRQTALQYLRKQEIAAGNMAKGWALVQFMGQNLGWIKQLGARANNYYPKEWRILKSA